MGSWSFAFGHFESLGLLVFFLSYSELIKDLHLHILRVRRVIKVELSPPPKKKKLCLRAMGSHKELLVGNGAGLITVMF